jgi:hypothetical protein
VKITYYIETDTLRIILSEVAIDESDEDKPGVILDYDAGAMWWGWRFPIRWSLRWFDALGGCDWHGFIAFWGLLARPLLFL